MLHLGSCALADICTRGLQSIDSKEVSPANLIPLLSVSSGAPAQTVLSGLYACAAFSGLSEKIEPVLRQRALIKQRKLQHQQQGPKGPPRVPPPRHMQYQSLNERRVHFA